MKTSDHFNIFVRGSIAMVSAMAMFITGPAYSLSGLYYGSELTAISASHTKGLTVSCPRGKQVLSGGADIPIVPGIRIIALEPDTQNGTWFRAEAAVEEPGFPGGDTNWQMTVYIICADPPPNGLHYGAVSGRANRDANQWVRPECAKGEKLVGFGGRVASDAEPRNVALTAVLPSADLRSVLVRGDEMEAGEDGDWFVTAYTVCTEDHVGLYSVGSSSGAPDGQAQKASNAGCDNGKRLYAIGGVVYSGFGQAMIYDLYPSSNTTGTMSATADWSGANNVWHVGTTAICGFGAE